MIVCINVCKQPHNTSPNSAQKMMTMMMCFFLSKRKKEEERSFFISSFEVDALNRTEVSSTMMMMNIRSAFLGWCCVFSTTKWRIIKLTREREREREEENSYVHFFFVFVIFFFLVYFPPMNVQRTVRLKEFHWSICFRQENLPSIDRFCD